MKQGDLFETDPKAGHSSEEPAPFVVRIDPEKVRAKLQRVLDELCAASTMPFNARDLLYWRTVVPQMSNWLPAAEAAQVRKSFAAELERLET